MKTFNLYRPEKEADGIAYLEADVSPVQGVLFDDGHCVVRWMTLNHSTACWPSFEDFMSIHGHEEYGTYIVWANGDKQTWRDGKLVTLNAVPARPTP
jgi:hypothetical protein